MILILNELLDKLAKVMVFNKFDLKSRYHQIRVRKEDVEKITYGHYEFLVMSFELSNTLATFQRLINEIFLPYLKQFFLVLFNVILVYSKQFDEHSIHTRIILKPLKDHHLVVNIKNCAFG